MVYVIFSLGETIQYISEESALEEGMATHSSILAWRILMDRGAWWDTVQGVRVRHDYVTSTSRQVSSGDWESRSQIWIVSLSMSFMQRC